MKFEYAQPFSFKIGHRPQPVVSRIRHGVTEIALSDGRVVRATLHVNAVKADPNKPGSVDVTYKVIAEIVTTPDMPILDAHETLQ